MKINQITLMKCKGLLPINFRINELANEIHTPSRQIRYWIDECGAPHFRDKRNHIWINGKELLDWALLANNKPKKQKLKDHEAYCFRCAKGVDLLDPITIPIKGKLVNFRGKCTQCGTIINRGGRLNG
jgi:hypothetical protein